jgi:20S proteasome subunit alpha 4
VERKALPKLQDEGKMHKIFSIDSHIGLACAGLTADSRVLSNMARLECQSYRFSLDEAPSVSYMAKFLGKKKQHYTQRGGCRPFGVSTLMIGYDKKGEGMLYQTEPSGSFSLWKANAIGRNAKTLQEFLEKGYKEAMTHEEGLKLVVQALLEVVESNKYIEIAFIKHDSPLTFIPQQDIAQIITEIEQQKESS